MRQMQSPQQKGFTLIELMIVVAIIAILAAVAFPSYKRYTLATRKSEAQQTMLLVADRQQQYLLNARQYAPDIATLNVTDNSDVYTISITAVDNTAAPPSFTVSAVPVAGSIAAGENTMTLDHLGTKAPASDWE